MLNLLISAKVKSWFSNQSGFFKRTKANWRKRVYNCNMFVCTVIRPGEIISIFPILSHKLLNSIFVLPHKNASNFFFNYLVYIVNFLIFLNLAYSYCAIQFACIKFIAWLYKINLSLIVLSANILFIVTKLTCHFF